MNMEKKIIARTIGYLISRDVLLAILVCGHIFVHYNFFPQMQAVIVSALAAGAVLWILFFTRLIKTVSTARKDTYLSSAFGDEYFKNIKTQAGYNGFIAMVVCCIAFILGSVLLSELPFKVDIPIYIAGEITLLVGVAADDISKITMSRG